MEFFVSDLDKTLLRSDLSISTHTKEVWNEMATKGHRLGIATARSLKKSLDFLEGMELNLPLILLDGAMVATKEKKIIRVHAITKALAKEIIAVGECFGVEPFIVGFDKEGEEERFLYPHKLNVFQEQLIAAYKNDNRLRAKERIEPLQKNLKIVYMGQKEQMQALEVKLKRHFGNAIEIKNAQDVYFECYFLTVLHPLGDKSHALEYLLEEADMKNAAVSVFGDSHNDIGMFEKAHTSIAVANAVEELKAKAHIVLPHTNDEDAVARYMKKLEV